MSDTKIQMNNNHNKYYNHFLKFLYSQRKTTLREIKFVKSRIKRNKKLIYIGFQNIDINWYFKTLKNKLKNNMIVIQEVRSKLIIC